MTWFKKLRIKIIDILAGDKLQIVLNVKFEDDKLYVSKKEPHFVKGCCFIASDGPRFLDEG